MCLFIETIRTNDGVLERLPLHQRRMERTRRHFFDYLPKLSLSEYVAVPAHCRKGLYKCRVTYGRYIEKVEFEPYVPRAIRSLKVLVCDDIDYSFKYADRSAISRLYRQRGDCDDILIIKDGRVTDTSYCNVAFWDGHKWITPAKPLLEGVRREELIASRMVSHEHIPVERVKELSKKMIAFNAMTIQRIMQDRR